MFLVFAKSLGPYQRAAYADQLQMVEHYSPISPAQSQAQHQLQFTSICGEEVSVKKTQVPNHHDGPTPGRGHQVLVSGVGVSSILRSRIISGFEGRAFIDQIIESFGANSGSKSVGSLPFASYTIVVAAFSDGVILGIILAKKLTDFDWWCSIWKVCDGGDRRKDKTRAEKRRIAGTLTWKDVDLLSEHAKDVLRLNQIPK